MSTDNLTQRCKDHWPQPDCECAGLIQDMADEIERLQRWKTEAMYVIEGWENVFEVLGRPGHLGKLKSQASIDEVIRLRAENTRLHNTIRSRPRNW